MRFHRVNGEGIEIKNSKTKSSRSKTSKTTDMRFHNSSCKREVKMHRNKKNCKTKDLEN